MFVFVEALATIDDLGFVYRMHTTLVLSAAYFGRAQMSGFHSSCDLLLLYMDRCVCCLILLPSAPFEV